MASPVVFVKEMASQMAYDEGLNELEPSAKRRKVMSLDEYKVRKSGKSYIIQTSSTGQGQGMEDGKRKQPTPAINTSKKGLYLPQETTSEPHALAASKVRLVLLIVEPGFTLHI